MSAGHKLNKTNHNTRGGAFIGPQPTIPKGLLRTAPSNGLILDHIEYNMQI